MSIQLAEVDWSGALCYQTDPEAWFGDHSGDHQSPARRTCGRCPLAGLDGPCLAAAMREPEMPHGIRAGLPQKRVQDLWAAWRDGREAPDLDCPHCGRQYTRMHQHIQMSHPEVNDGEFRCHCGLAYHSRAGLSQHRRKMHGATP